MYYEETCIFFYFGNREIMIFGQTSKVQMYMYNTPPRKQHKLCPYKFFRSIPMYAWEWTSYQICKIAGCACAGNAGNVFPRRRFQRKLLVSDPGMHHGTCVTHVPWCMSGSLTCGDGENGPGIPGACAQAILRIWQEAHCRECCNNDHGHAHKTILRFQCQPVLSLIGPNCAMQCHRIWSTLTPNRHVAWWHLKPLREPVLQCHPLWSYNIRMMIIRNNQYSYNLNVFKIYDREL